MTHLRGDSVRYRFKTINLDEVWQKEQGWNEEKKSGRQFDDRKELAFWEKLAPDYSQQFNLYRDVPGLKEKISSIIGKGSYLLDLGCGSGNFALPFSKQCREILALDFSPAMLEVLSREMKKQDIRNIRTVCSKWEDFSQPCETDFVLAVNSLYWVCYMREALKKIVLYGRKGFIIVRTLLKPLLYRIYDDLNLDYHRNNDYMLMPLMLWDMGIHADVEFMKYDRTKLYPTLASGEEEMKSDLGELTYMNFNNQLEEKFLHHCEKTEEGYLYRSERIVQVISFVKEG